ncbi:unnamed protein product [Moneuplotes crassus]|uniref:Uncharacterized protein n=1 Tax=Euplotes crassus TaxID=5936 RepID=A0AAD2D797_EUPCR|nr:unnamed protein product [Moneuplotes crassus]
MLVQKHNCILKYGEEHETITDILKCCYQELGNQHSLCYKSRNHRHNSNEDLLDQSKSQCYDCFDNGDFSVAINDESKLDETLQRFNKHVHSRTQVHDDFIRDAPKVDFSRLKKLNTLRIHKIQQIMEADYKVQGVKLFDLHLLNMKNSQTKYLQPKDAIEMAIIFCLFDGDQIHRLASLVYSWTEQQQSEANSKFPISVYKLMLFYEELDAFHKMFS